MIQNVFLIGPGNIGRAFLSRVIEKDLEECKNHINPTRIVGIANSTGFIFSENGIPTETLTKISESQKLSKQIIESKGAKFSNLQELIQRAQRSSMRDVVFVDSTSLEEPMIEFHKSIIRNGFRIVTANKNPLSLCSIEDYYLLTQKKGFYEGKTTVMAGNGPWEFIDHKEKIAEPITHISGCINGTTVFTFGEFNKSDKPFSECFRLAHEKGYTEPNPQDDLNGVDPARKLTILARRAGYIVEYKDIKIEPFLQQALLVSPDSFWETLKEEDEQMNLRRQNARDQDCVLHHVAEMILDNNGNPKLSISLKEVSNKSPFAQLVGTKNCIIVETELYKGETAHEVRSPGAGIIISADSLREGVAELLPEGSIGLGHL